MSFFLVHITDKSRGNFQASDIAESRCFNNIMRNLPPSISYIFLLCCGVIPSGSSLGGSVSSYLYLCNLATSTEREHLSKNLSRCHWLWLAQYEPHTHWWTNHYDYGHSQWVLDQPWTSLFPANYRDWVCTEMVLQRKIGMLSPEGGEMQKPMDAHISCLTAYYLPNVVISPTRINEI